MAIRKITGTGKITDKDFKTVTWTGKTKAGNPIKIVLHDAINVGALEWAYADKGEVTSEITFTGSYTQEQLDGEDNTKEPFEIYVEGEDKGAESFILGAGVLAVEGVKVGLSRGGGKFARGEEIRNIECDGDRGQVKGRVVMDGATPTLSMTMVEILEKVADLYPALKEETADAMPSGKTATQAAEPTEE